MTMDVHSLHTLSHELRSPLTAIVGYATLLLNRHAHDPETAEQLRIVLDNAEHLLQVADGIVSGARTPKIADLDPWRVAEVSVSALQPSAESHGLRLGVAAISGLPRTIASSATAIRQILSNLLHNSIRYTREGGVRCEVGIVMVDSRPLLRYSVIDTGPGMDREQVERLFVPFSQVHTGTLPLTGVGLGLWISQQLAVAINARLWVDSHPGRGSRFHLDLPVTLEELAAIDRGQVPGQRARGSGLAGRLVLVADDNPTNRLLMSSLLKRAGAGVMLVPDGQAALSLFEDLRSSQVTPDIIVLDIHMPRLDGWQTLARLRAAGWRGPTIAVSSNHDITLQVCTHSGFDDFLPKPFSNQEFIARITRFATPGA